MKKIISLLFLFMGFAALAQDPCTTKPTRFDRIKMNCLANSTDVHDSIVVVGSDGIQKVKPFGTFPHLGLNETTLINNFSEQNIQFQGGAALDYWTGTYHGYLEDNAISATRQRFLPNNTGTLLLDVNGHYGNTAGHIALTLVQGITGAGVNNTDPANPVINAAVPTLQSILNYNHELTDGNNFQGTDAGSGNTAINSIGIGTEALGANTGANSLAIGQGCGSENSGVYLIALGAGAGQSNTGINVNALGGNGPAVSNTGNNINALGNNSLSENTGDHANAFGQSAGVGNIYKNINLFGFEAAADADNQNVYSKWISGTTKYLLRLSFDDITTDRNQHYQDKDGTLAYMDDIPTSIPGNSGTATALQTGRTIGIITGDAVSTGSAFDGTGDNSNSLTLATVNPNVGTFGSATKSVTTTVNAKGLITAITEQTLTPAIGSVTGLGTGIATAAAVNVGTAGSMVINGGALGTPSSGNLTNCTFPTLNQNTSGSAATVTTTINSGVVATTQSANDNSTKVATTAYVDTADALKVNKSIAAYSMNANNTASTANMTTQTFQAVAQQTYAGTIAWTGTTPPSGSTSHSYSWMQIGNMVTLSISLSYGSPGSALTSVTLSLPADCPNPVKPSGSTAASEKLYMGVGNLSSVSTTIATTATTTVLRSNAANNGFEIVGMSTSSGWRYYNCTITYFTN